VDLSIRWSSPAHAGAGRFGVKWSPRSTLTSSSLTTRYRQPAPPPGIDPFAVLADGDAGLALQARASEPSFGVIAWVM
jgi:hypothetical protein